MFRKSFAFNAGVLLIILLSVGIFVFQINQAKAAGTTYYVDSVGGLNTNSGTSSSTPWATIAKVNGSTFQPGDSILFKAGDVWREQLTVPSSGSPGNPITFGSYGSGSKPIISGEATLSSTWSSVPIPPVDTETYESSSISSYWDTVAGVVDTTNYKNGSASWRYAPSSGNLMTQKSGGTNTNYAEIVTWFRLDASSTAGAWDQTSVMSMDGSSWNAANEVGVWVDKTGDGSHYELSLGQGSPGGVNGSRYAISTNTWYQLRFVVTANNGSGNAHTELYVNGTQESSLTGLTLASAINSALRMGAYISQSTHFKVNFDDTSVYTTNSAAATNIWATNSVNDPWVLTVDGNFGVRQTSAGNLASQYDFSYDSVGQKLYLYSPTDPTNRTILYAARGEAIYAIGQSHLIFQNLEVRFGGWENLLIANSPGDITINNITSKYSYRDGVNLQWANHGGVTDGVNVLNSTFSDVLSEGIGITQSKNVHISGNDISSFAIDNSIDYANGIQIGDDVTHGPLMTNILIENNHIYNGGEIYNRQVSSGLHGEGIHLDTVGTGAVVRYNLVHDCAATQVAGIHVEIGTSAVVYGNVVYNIGGEGILVSTWGTNIQNGNLVYNNVAYHNGIGISVQGSNPATAGGTVNNQSINNISLSNTTQNFSATYGGENPGTNGSGNVYTYNDFGPTSSNFIEWGAGNYLSTYSAFDTAYGTSTHSIQADPLFVSTSTDNFALSSLSPAIDAGLNLGTTYQLGLDPASTWPSSVITDNQNSFGAGWDLGAYVYTQTSTPSITWLSPAASSTVSSTITISASSTAVSPASIFSVQFYLDGSPLGSAVTSSPYTISWNTAAATNGSHTLYALATDNYSNTATSTLITVTVLNQAVLSVPTSTLSFSAAHGSTATSTQSVVVKNTSIASTTLNWSASSTETWLTFSPSSGSLSGNATTSISFIVNPATLALGTYNATATISDPAASSSPQTIPVTLTISSTGVSATITAPLDGTTLSGTASITASATSTAGIASLSLLIDGSPVTSTTASSLSYSWDTTGALNGTHAISLLATDTYNNSASSSISVTVANAATSTTPSPVVEVASGGGGGSGYTPAPVTTTQTSPAATSTTVSTSSLQAQLNTLLAELQALEAKAGITSSSSPYVFTRNLTIGSNGSDVEALQHYLNTHGFPVVATPTYAGSLGYETQYFGKATQTALAEFQKSVGISPAVGFFGPITRAYVNGQ